MLAAVMLLLLGPAAYAVVELAAIRDIAADLAVENTGAAMALGRVEANRAELARYQRSYIAAPALSLRDQMHATAMQAREELGRIERAGYPAADSAGAWLDSLAAANRSIERMVENERMDEATAYLGEVRRLYGYLDRSLERIAVEIDQGGAEKLARAQEISAAATHTAFLTALLGAIAAAWVGVWTTELLADPLRRLRAAMSRVAGGSLRVPEELPYERIDEIGNVARSFRTMTRRLSELDRIKAEFVGMASHELKTPVNLVRGYIDLMEEAIATQETDRCTELFEPVRKQTRTLSRLVDHLLEISRMEAGGFRIHPESTETRGFFSGVEKAFEPLAIKRGIDFVAEVAPSAPHAFFADPDCLRDEVLGNLLVNAFRFTPEGGRVRVRVGSRRGDGEGIRITISDTGPGIAAEQLPYVFEKFWRAGHETGRVGTGLGLAIAREVVALHGGSISAISEQGGGATFEVRLPPPPVRLQLHDPPISALP